MRRELPECSIDVFVFNKIKYGKKVIRYHYNIVSTSALFSLKGRKMLVLLNRGCDVLPHQVSLPRFFALKKRYKKNVETAVEWPSGDGSCKGVFHTTLTPFPLITIIYGPNAIRMFSKKIPIYAIC